MALPVTTFDQLQDAIQAADQDAAGTGPIEIDIQGNIAETTDPAAINLASGNTLTIVGEPDANGNVGALGRRHGVATAYSASSSWLHAGPDRRPRRRRAVGASTLARMHGMVARIDCGGPLATFSATRPLDFSDVGAWA